MAKRDKENCRTVKFTGYIYLPGKTGEKVGYKDLRYCASNLGAGRVQLYDQKMKKLGKAKAFCHVGGLLNIILNDYKARSFKRVPKDESL